MNYKAKRNQKLKTDSSQPSSYCKNTKGVTGQLFAIEIKYLMCGSSQTDSKNTVNLEERDQ